METELVCVWLSCINPLNAELNPIFYLLALLGAHHFLHVSSIRVRSYLNKKVAAPGLDNRD